MSSPSAAGRPERTRIDVALVERGLAPSRTAARRLVEAGQVRSGDAVVERPSQPVEPDTALEVLDAPRYVSRAAHKLDDALEALAASSLGAPIVSGRRVLDAGASTGGFTQVVLERGAAHVVAVDVGHDQIASALREDSRVTVHEGVNVRHLDPALVAPAAELLVADLSFISLGLVLAPLAACLTDDADAVVLVKPQFEVGRGRLGKGGVVTDDVVRADAVTRVLLAARTSGFATLAALPSSVQGEHGNREVVVWLRRTGPLGTPIAVVDDDAPADPTDSSTGDAIERDIHRMARLAATGHLAVAEWGV